MKFSKNNWRKKMSSLTPMELIEQGIIDQEWLPVQQALKILTGKTVAIPTQESLENDSLPDLNVKEKTKSKKKSKVVPVNTPKSSRTDLSQFDIQNGPVRGDKNYATAVAFEAPKEPNQFDKDKKLATVKASVPETNLNYLKNVKPHDPRDSPNEEKFTVECIKCGANCQVDAWEKTLLDRADTAGFTCNECIRKRVKR